MSSQTKKIIIPATAAILVAAVLVGVIAMSPSFAAAQNTTSSNNQTTPPTITGSVNVRQTITNYIKDKAKVSFTQAADAAAQQVDNGQVVRGNLGIVQGYLTYTFSVVNTTNQTGYLVIVDAGNGSVLYTSHGHSVGGMFGGNGMMFGKHEGMWANHHGMMHHANPGNSTQPSTTPSSSGSVNESIGNI